jgi:hypothetical protein
VVVDTLDELLPGVPKVAGLSFQTQAGFHFNGAPHSA